MNRINSLLSKKDNILSIYFTAGYPNLGDTELIIKTLEESGADLLEVGVPFSDPIADGPTIQNTNTAAIENGMTVKLLFEQLDDIRSKVSIPLIAMSSLNPILQYGFENFCAQCKEVGLDGLIIPDLPVEEYVHEYKDIVERYGLKNIILITPASTDDRIKMVDDNTDAFIYMVSSSAITGANKKFATDFEAFADRLERMDLNNPRITGFGIRDKKTFDEVCKTSKGGIIGSAFVKALEKGNVEGSVKSFMSQFS